MRELARGELRRERIVRGAAWHRHLLERELRHQTLRLCAMEDDCAGLLGADDAVIERGAVDELSMLVVVGAARRGNTKDT